MNDRRATDFRTRSSGMVFQKYPCAFSTLTFSESRSGSCAAKSFTVSMPNF
jgi:hypothetical protein